MKRRTSQEAIRNAIFISIVLILTGIIFLIGSINLQMSGHAGVAPDIVRDVGILITSIGLISVAYELLLRKQLLADYNEIHRSILDPDTKGLGVKSLFSNRTDKLSRGYLPEVLIREARSEVFCLGLGLSISYPSIGN